MKRFLLAACAVLVGSVRAAEPDGLAHDAAVTSRATGFFRLEQDTNGVWRFVTPGGHGFFLAANNGPAKMAGDACPALGYSPYTRTLEAKYGKDRARWAAEESARLKAWKFNAISSWEPPAKGLTETGLASVRVVQFGKSYAKSTPNNDSNLLDNVEFKGKFPNVFRPDFADHCRKVAKKFCAKERDNPWIVGWYTDNEITWRGAVKQDANGISGDARAGTGMYDAVAKLPPEHTGRQALDTFLKERNLAVGDKGVTKEVKQAFLRLVAEKYYRITTSAIRAAAPNHLVLGCRFAGFRSTPDIVWREGGKWNDAMSVNSYPPADLTNGYVKAMFTDDHRPLSSKLREVYRMCQKPILLTEWSYPARDTPCPNRHGAGQRVPTQKERAAASALMARTLIGEPEVVGYSYFRWADQPALGRWKKTGGEDCNYGLVNEQDEPYELLTRAFAEVHGEMYDLRRRIGTADPAVRPASTVPYPRFKTYSKKRGGLWWKPRHQAKLAEIAAAGEYDLVLLGDSITHYWEEAPYAAASWAALTNACRTLNLGFAGDQTQQVLWRIDNGELDGYRAKRIVLLIGTNNSTSDCTQPWETALGVRAILDRIRAKQPQAQVVLTAIFPRGRGDADAHHAAARRRNDATNAILRRFADGKKVVWMDFNDRLVGPNGWTTPDLFPDRIHPSEAGYRIWLEELGKILPEGTQSHGGTSPCGGLNFPVSLFEGAIDPKGGHVQGIAVGDEAVYVSQKAQLTKIGFDGKVLAKRSVVCHTGDVTWWNGELYTAVAVYPDSKIGKIEVFDKDLKPVRETTFDRTVDGIACLDGVLYVGMGAKTQPSKKPHRVNVLGRFDAKTLQETAPRQDFDYGHDTKYGFQDIATDGKLLYATFYAVKGAPVMAAFGKDGRLAGVADAGSNQGFDFLPGGAGLLVQRKGVLSVEPLPPLRKMEM